MLLAFSPLVLRPSQASASIVASLAPNDTSHRPPITNSYVAGSHRCYRIELRIAGGGGGFSEATLLPVELNAEVGARGLSLGTLEPNEEVIHWGTLDANNLPANGLIGLRVTVVPHGLNKIGTGTAHIDWKKSQTMQSTTRRKLSE